MRGKFIIMAISTLCIAQAHGAGDGCFKNGTKNCDSTSINTWVDCTFTDSSSATSTKNCWVSNQPTKPWTVQVDPGADGLDATKEDGTCSWNCYYMDANIEKDGTCTSSEKGASVKGNACKGK